MCQPIPWSLIRASCLRSHSGVLALCGVAALGLSLLTMEPGKAVGDDAAEATDTADANHKTAAKSDDADLPRNNPEAPYDNVIEGRVVDSSGQPIPGAEVGLVDDEVTEPARPSTFKRTGITNQDGHFATRATAAPS